MSTGKNIRTIRTSPVLAYQVDDILNSLTLFNFHILLQSKPGFLIPLGCSLMTSLEQKPCFKKTLLTFFPILTPQILFLKIFENHNNKKNSQKQILEEGVGERGFNTDQSSSQGLAMWKVWLHHRHRLLSLSQFCLLSISASALALMLIQTCKQPREQLWEKIISFFCRDKPWTHVEQLVRAERKKSSLSLPSCPACQPLFHLPSLLGTT